MFELGWALHFQQGIKGGGGFQGTCVCFFSEQSWRLGQSVGHHSVPEPRGLKELNLLPVCCQGVFKGIPSGASQSLRWDKSPLERASPTVSITATFPGGCFAPAAVRAALLELWARCEPGPAWPEVCGSKHLPRSLQAPDGDAGVFPASFLLSAVALAFCTAGPKCVFHGVRAQRWTGRGCSWVLLGSLALALLLSWLGLDLACGVAGVQDSKCPCPSNTGCGAAPVTRRLARLDLFIMA